MTSQHPETDTPRFREVLVVLALTVVGGLVRLWSFGRVGLNHFDEGVYALAGLWAFAPGGLRDLDPSLVPYAPPGFPVLIGLAYLGLGVADYPAILISVASGTLTIPVSAWVARRTFGRGAGGAAAALAAISGFHVSFSRMALTDVTYLLVWLVALGLGQRFLERPGAARATAFGLAVGLAQLFKYSGWTAGVIVAASAAVWLFRPEGRQRAAVAETWGWGLLAALVAAAVYAPWFKFVENHGGYAALMAHHRHYVGGMATWPGHLHVQLAQAKLLCGGPAWAAAAGLLAGVSVLLCAGNVEDAHRSLLRALARIGTVTLASLWLMPPLDTVWILVWLCLALFQMKTLTRSMCVAGVAWAFLAAVTPLYHPYARLWLPLQALNWLFLGQFLLGMGSPREFLRRAAERRGWQRTSDLVPWLALMCLVGAAVRVVPPSPYWAVPTQPILAASDSLRGATLSLVRSIPTEPGSVRALVRPPVLFYLALAGRAAVLRQPDLPHLLEPTAESSWALLDTALVRQNGLSPSQVDQLLVGWSVVADKSTTLNLPTLLDIAPESATADTTEAVARLRLLRRERRVEAR